MSLPETLPPESTAAAVPAASGELVPFTGGAFSVQPTDLGDFQKLTEAGRERVLLLLSCFQRMEGDVVGQPVRLFRKVDVKDVTPILLQYFKRPSQRLLDCAAMGAAQRAGRVKEFWPFFKAIVGRYVGVNAEELKLEAMHAGTHINLCVKTLLKSAGKVSLSLPELVAMRREETLREKLTRKRREDASKAAVASTPQLF